MSQSDNKECYSIARQSRFGLGNTQVYTKQVQHMYDCSARTGSALPARGCATATWSQGSSAFGH